MVTGIISIGLGIVFMLFGYLIYVKKKYHLINDFAEQRKKRLATDLYASRVGLIELITGIAAVMYGVISLIVKITPIGIIGTVMICLVAIIALAVNSRKKA